LDRVRGLPLQCQYATLVHYAKYLPEQDARFVRQRHHFVALCARRRIVTAEDMIPECEGQSKHQRGGVTDLTRILLRAIRFGERTISIAEHP